MKRCGGSSAHGFQNEAGGIGESVDSILSLLPLHRFCFYRFTNLLLLFFRFTVFIFNRFTASCFLPIHHLFLKGAGLGNRDGNIHKTSD